METTIITYNPLVEYNITYADQVWTSKLQTQASLNYLASKISKCRS